MSKYIKIFCLFYSEIFISSWSYIELYQNSIARLRGHVAQPAFAQPAVT
jgi:hypothetical protein